MKVYVRSAAREDILRQFRYYLVDKDAAPAAERFVDAVQSAIDELRRNPEIGAPRHLSAPELKGLRSWPVPDFPAIRIYYIHAADSLRIVRVLHGKRDVSVLLEEEFGASDD